MSNEKSLGDIGSRFRIVRDQLGVNQKKFATSLGIAQGFLSEIENGVKPPSDTLIIALINLYEISETWLKTGEGSLEPAGDILPENQCQKIPVHSFAGAGGGSDFTSAEPIDTIMVPKKLLSPSILVVKIQGQSMEPTILNNAIVGIDKSVQRLVSGQLYAVWVPHEGAIVKRVFFEMDKIILKSDNPSFPPFSVSHGQMDEHFLIGRVKWVIQEF